MSPPDANTAERTIATPVAARPSMTREQSRPLGKTRDMLEMIRFSHTLFALPFAFLAAAMAWHETAREMTIVRVSKSPWDWLRLQVVEVIKPTLSQFIHWPQVFGILLAMVFARSAAMAFNRLVDRQHDAANPRTATRHLPSGRLSVVGVALFAVLASLGFIASTLLFLPNRLPLYLSLPVLAFVFGYSYAKRFTFWSHAWLGASLMLAPICAWIALRGDAVWNHPADLQPALILGAAVLLWVTGFDIIYACQDAEHDRRVGLYSVPARFGVCAALWIAALCHLGMVALLWWLRGSSDEFSTVYCWTVGAVALLLLYEHWIVRPDDLTRVNRAFFQVNAVVSLGLFAMATLDLYWF